MSDFVLDQDENQQFSKSKSTKVLRFCPDCGYETYDSSCPHCGTGTVDDVGADTALSGQEKYSEEMGDDFNDKLSNEDILEDNLDQYDKFNDE